MDWHRRLVAAEGLVPDGQMGVMDLLAVTTFLTENDIGVLFPESNLNRDPLKKVIEICREKGHRVRLSPDPLYGDTMGGGEVSSHLEMIEHNVITLIKLLGEDLSQT